MLSSAIARVTTIGSPGRRREDRRRGLDRQLQGVQQRARVAARDVDEVVERVRVDVHVEAAVAALGVGQRRLRDAVQVRTRERRELEDARPADERRVHLEVGVVRGGADQHDGAVLHPGQERILLSLVPAVHLVHEEDGAPAVQLPPLVGRRRGLADVLHPGEHGVQALEVAPRGVRDDPGEGGLPRARRPVEDERGQLVRLDRAAQQAPGAEDVVLAHELLDGPGPHARRERLAPAAGDVS